MLAQYLKAVTLSICVTMMMLIYCGISQAADDTFALPLLSFKKVDDANLSMTIDGRLDEAVWNTVAVYDNMRVTQPDTLEAVPFETQVRFFYTEQGLYIGIWNEQPKDTHVVRLSPRDQFISRDGISFTLDPSGEGLYGYWFAINLGGALADGTVLPERQFSRQWDGAWRGAAEQDENGWSVEYFLPWSIMTMPEISGDKRQMGFYLSRSVSHLGERWTWPALPESKSVFITVLQKFEINNIKPAKQFNLFPYASIGYFSIEDEDDYKTGFDLFWRPSSNLQITATVNPDFGNVESDDVVVNLTSLETFFPEKRPFFLEGQEIFQTSPRAVSEGRGTPTILVNTRRIGSPPVPPPIDGFDIDDLEENQPSELVAAAKVTGQQGNWRYGVIAAAEEQTKITGTIESRGESFVSEGRDFAAARLLYESTNNGSRTGIGWISTIVDHPLTQAEVHGIDGHYLAAGGRWNINGQALHSDVDGISGDGAFVDIDYNPRQGIQHSLGIDYFDENIDINDFGFLRRNDAIGARYQFELTESDIPSLKSRETTMSLSQEYNTAGLLVRSGIFFEQRRRFHNNSFLFTEMNYFPARWDDLNSEGHGDFRINPRRQGGFFWASDNSRAIRVAHGIFFEDEQIDGQVRLYESELNWRPNDRVAVELKLRYRERSDWLLYDHDAEFTTFSARTWEPELKLDFFFTATQQIRISAQWVGIKAFEKNRWRVPAAGGSLITDPAEATDTPRDFSISRLVFQARYRWEIAPLSDLFVVYTRGSNLDSDPTQQFGDLLRSSWSKRAIDVFVIKLRYRLGN